MKVFVVLGLLIAANCSGRSPQTAYTPDAYSSMVQSAPVTQIIPILESPNRVIGAGTYTYYYLDVALSKQLFHKMPLNYLQPVNSNISIYFRFGDGVKQSFGSAIIRQGSNCTIATAVICRFIVAFNYEPIAKSIRVVIFNQDDKALAQGVILNTPIPTQNDSTLPLIAVKPL